MVKIRGRKMIVSPKEESVGFVGDNKTEVREFEITDKALFGFDFKLDLTIKEHVDIVDLEKVVEQDRVVLRWIIEKKHLPINGMLLAQLRAFNDEGASWHSEKKHFWIIGAINAEKSLPSPLPSEFAQIEQQVTTARNETISAKNTVLEKASKISENTQTVLDKTEIVIQKANDVQASREIVLQNTDSAIDSANIASQSLADLLAMLGTDIASLTNGKLTPSQIPAIAITDTFVANSENEMLSLQVQTGDICIRTDESKTYVFSDNSWLYMQSPTNYADSAGIAQTAINAENADRINNHRLVIMSESQFESAVIDPDTLYIVIPEGVA